MEDIFNYLKANELNKAFDLLAKVYSQKPNHYSDLVVLINRYNKLKKDVFMGVIAHKDEQVTENKLVYDTVNYLNTFLSPELEKKEPRLEVIQEIILDNPLEEAFIELDYLSSEYPESRYIPLAFASLELRKGLNKMSGSLVNQRFAELYQVLQENNPMTYKTAFCLMLIYKYDYYDAWELPLPVIFTSKYNSYIGSSQLVREFLVKMKLSSKAKKEVKFIYKSMP